MKYKGKSVKVGDAIEVPIKFTVVAGGGGHITACSSVPVSSTVVVDDEDPDLDDDGKPKEKSKDKPLVVKMPKFTKKA